jgi:hypothetical protein
MTESIVEVISASASHYTTQLSGSAYVLKDAKYRPWKAYTGSIGRYNGPGTGSLYLGENIETCEAEVGRTNKTAYVFSMESAGATKILDLERWGRDNPQFSGSLLIESESGGWEPTREISDWAHGAGYHGIRFESHVSRGSVNFVLWHDRATITQDAFSQLEPPADA